MDLQRPEALCEEPFAIGAVVLGDNGSASLMSTKLAELSASDFLLA